MDVVYKYQRLSVDVHDLPVTGLGFAPTTIAKAHGVEAMLATCSADNKMSIIRIERFNYLLLFIKILFVLIIILLIYFMLR